MLMKKVVANKIPNHSQLSLLSKRKHIKNIHQHYKDLFCSTLSSDFGRNALYVIQAFFNRKILKIITLSSGVISLAEIKKKMALLFFKAIFAEKIRCVTS
jgi:hypothetical protein